MKRRARKQPPEPDRNLWLERLDPFRRPPLPTPKSAATCPTPPSRRHRKTLTTWQDKVALKFLKQIAAETGISQQALIAEGLNYVLAKYRKPGVAS